MPAPKYQIKVEVGYDVNPIADVNNIARALRKKGASIHEITLFKKEVRGSRYCDLMDTYSRWVEII
tara:strand:- start:494 stop:691 length:198 start_codon:yes stop_codon:yes gene_type:complete